MPQSSMPVAAAKISRHLISEKFRKPKAYTLADIPGSVDAITPEWLTEVLCADVPGAKVISFRKGRGDFGSHERREIILNYNDVGSNSSDLPATVFTKTLPSLMTRMLVGYMGHARYEKLFYQKIRPELDIETPRWYHSASDRETYAAIHVIEDVAHGGATYFGDELLDVTRPMAEDMTRLMADIHGPLYDDPRLTTEWKWLLDYSSWFRAGIRKVQMDKHSAKAITGAEDVIPARLMARRGDIWPATMKALEAHETEKHTVLHSDTHIANWYHLPDGRMGILDWQCINKGCWARDLSYALVTALSVENRRAWDRELLDLYVDRMAEKWDVRIDRDHAWLRFRQQLFHALVMWTQTLSHPRFQPVSHSRGRILTLINRIATAIDDHDALDLLK